MVGREQQLMSQVSDMDSGNNENGGEENAFQILREFDLIAYSKKSVSYYKGHPMVLKKEVRPQCPPSSMSQY